MIYSSRTIILILALVCAVTGGAVLAADQAPAATGKPGALSRLSPHLQKLFVEEMVAINVACQNIVGALARGDSATVAQQAQGIHDSFILEKKLSKQDSAALEELLPQGFLMMDATLHAQAQRLAAAAQHGDLELESFYFGRMIETCQACHGRFAADKFPGFAPRVPIGNPK